MNARAEMDDDYIDPPMICPVTREPCIRAFCDDYGCATKAGVPCDDYDVECGTMHIDELVPVIPRPQRKRKPSP